MNRFVLISGCSGGGKSTLLAELAQRGYATVEEPGRRIVKEEMLGAGTALPWVNEVAFARRAIEMALADRAAASCKAGWVFFDRGVLDAAAALERLTGEPAMTVAQAHRYHRTIFVTPPWPDIYVGDAERRHTLDDAMVEYRHITDLYPSLGYEVAVLPKISVDERADFVLHALNSTTS